MRQALEDLVKTWQHRADTNTNGAFQSATLMCMTDLVSVLIKHGIEQSRHATTEPADPPGDADEEPDRLPPMRAPRVPVIPEDS